MSVLNLNVMPMNDVRSVDGYAAIHFRSKHQNHEFNS